MRRQPEDQDMSHELRAFLSEITELVYEHLEARRRPSRDIIRNPANGGADDASSRILPRKR